MFNSSENFTVLEGNGARLPTFEVTKDEPAILVLTHYPKHKPVFSVQRIAGRLCEANCPDSCATEVVAPHIDPYDKQQVFLSYKNPHVTITLPGTYYLHSAEADWMNAPCYPVIVEKF